MDYGNKTKIETGESVGFDTREMNLPLPESAATIDAKKVLGLVGEKGIDAAEEIDMDNGLGRVEVADQTLAVGNGSQINNDEEKVFADGVKIDGDRGLNAVGMREIEKSFNELNKGKVADFYAKIRNSVPKILQDSYADRADAVEKMGKVA